MNNLIETLKNKYNKLCSRQKEYDSNVNELNSNINKLLNAFDDYELLDDEDKKGICNMLDKEHVLLFKSNEKFFKAIKKFPNQPQVKKAKEVLLEIKNCLKEKIILDNKEVFDIVSENNKKLKVIKYYIDLLEKYNNDTYISSYDLYTIASLLHNSEIDDSIIDFYNSILINNNFIEKTDENEELSNEEYDSFIKRMKQINKSMCIEEFNDDKKIYNLLVTISEKNYEINYDDSDINSFMNIFNQQINSNDENDKELVKRIKFLIHLHNVQVDLTDEQKDFLGVLKEFYYEKVSSHTVDESSNKICELISYLEDDYKFENVSLLVNVFKAMEIKQIDQLKLIALITKNNSEKKCNEKNDFSGGIIELLDSNGISTDKLTEEEIEKLNSNLNNASEVIKHINKIYPDYLKSLDNDDSYFILVDLLIYSSKELINKIAKICNNAEIDIKSLLDYSPNILISNKIKRECYGEYDNFINNIDFCEQNNISPKDIENILLMDNKVLCNRYNILTKLYGLDISDCYNVLENEIIYVLIDMTIENHKLGYKYIKSNFKEFVENAFELSIGLIYCQDFLSYDDDNEEKVCLNKRLLDDASEDIKESLGDDYYLIRYNGAYWKDKYDDLMSLLNYTEDRNGRPYWIIPDKYDYIDESIFENPYIAHLENPKNKLKKNDYIYNLDGVYISRIKTLRICTFFKEKLQDIGENFDSDIVRFALRYEKSIRDGSVEQKIDHFNTVKKENKTKKKKKK